jgi:hypothetical protein
MTEMIRATAVRNGTESNTPKLNAPTRLRSGVWTQVSGMVAIPVGPQIEASPTPR